MITVLLADDDILTLNRLTGIIDWNSNGYDIIGQVSNGLDCLKKIAELNPDILILDIDMPVKNGVEVANEIQKKQIKTSILILSNYDNFEFVRDAMRYGAYDYLLKHEITSDSLLKKLNEMRDQLEKDDKNTSRLTYFTSVAKQQYLNNLVQHGITNQTEHAYMITQTDYSSKHNILAVMQITNFIIVTHFSPSLSREKLIESIRSLSSNIFASIQNGIMTYMDYGQFVVLFHFQNEVSNKKILDQANSYMRILISNIHKLMNLAAIYQISDVIADLSSLNRYYNKVISKLNCQSIEHTKQSENTQAYTIDIIEEKALMDALLSLDTAKMKVVLEQIFKKYTKDNQRLSQQIIFQLVQLGFRFQESQGINLIKQNKEEIKISNLEEKSKEDIFEFLVDFFMNLITIALNYDNSKYSKHVKNAIVYIRENYNKEISLMELAEHIQVSHTHLSRIFRKETSSSFIDYLTSFRIERAQQLIQNSNMELKDIANQVGYRNYNYFLRVYKEKTGHTPSQETI